MKNKKIVITAALMLGLAGLWGCGEDNSATVDSERIVEEQTTENKENDASEPLSSDAGEADSRFRLNQTVEFELDNGGKMNVTLTGWGKGNAMYNNAPYVWIAYTIENTGEEKITVGNSLFTIYADDYAADSLVFSEDNKGVAVAELSSGRKVDGELYAAIDPENVSVIEVELWNAVFVIKDNMEGINGADVQNTNTGKTGEDFEAISAYLGQYKAYDDENAQINLYVNDDWKLQVVCSIVGGDTYYEQIYDSFAIAGSTLHGYAGNVDDEYELIDSGMLDVLLSGYGSTHYQTYIKLQTSDNGGASDGEKWNLGEFSEDWYKVTPNFEDAEGNTLEIIYDDYGELQFAVNGLTMYYGMASEHTDYGDGIYIYTLKDDSENEVTMLYYPKDTVQIDSMVFTVVR